MKKSVTYIVGLLHFIAIGLFLACTDETERDIYPLAGKEVSVHLSFLAPSGEIDRIATRMTPAEESEIAEVFVVWFDPSGQYVHKAAGLEPEQNSNIYTCRFLMNSGTYDIMVFANSGTWIDTIYPSGIPANTTREQLLQVLVAECAGTWTGSTIPMWGLKENVTIDKDNASISGISLTRSLARIDITVDPALASLFELEEVILYRNYQKGRLAPVVDAAHWDNSVPEALAPSLPTGSGLINNDGKTFPVTGNSLMREIYTFETPAGEDIASTLNDQNPCLVLKAKYNGGSSTYYRIDFIRDNASATEYLPLLRNNIYEITITGVEREGAGSAGEALKGRPAHITYDLSDLSKSGMLNIAWNGQHYLMASVETLSYWRDASSQALRILTNHAAGWKVAEQPSWVTVSPTYSEYTAESLVTVSVLQNSTAAPRTGQIIFSAGELQLKVTIEQSELEAFSLVVDPISLIFYEQPAAGEVVTITTIPASLNYTLAVTGDITYRNWPGNSGNSPSLTVWPTDNTSGTILTGIITVSVTHPDGRILREDIAVRQYPGAHSR